MVQFQREFEYETKRRWSEHDKKQKKDWKKWVADPGAGKNNMFRYLKSRSGWNEAVRELVTENGGE